MLLYKGLHDHCKVDVSKRWISQRCDIINVIMKRYILSNLCNMVRMSCKHVRTYLCCSCLWVAKPEFLFDTARCKGDQLQFNHQLRHPVALVAAAPQGDASGRTLLGG